MSSGKKQHFMPAALIGQFSFESPYSSKHLRDRLVYVRFRQSPDIKELSASAILKEKNFYTIQDETTGLQHDSVDNIWDEVEPFLPKMIKRLSDLYAKDVMPSDLFIYFAEFCTQLIVRNPSFNESYDSRINSFFEYDSLEENGLISVKDNTNASRIMEMQRLRPLLLYSDVSILRASKHTYFINNDVGYVIGPDQVLQRATITFPLTPDLAIQFHVNRTADKYNIDLLKSPKKFDHHRLYAESVNQFNKSVYSLSNILIYGNRKSILTSDFPVEKNQESPYGFWYIFDQENLLKLGRQHELDFLSLGQDTPIFHDISEL
ncbi:DUF4238 domain-containing protein [Leuconostoc mesenteroides]|uniref:DUF4238 domain-containing protein n=1 Tax=Leuconostoc mesenteroides TaxID=1245 RepID=UPI001CC051F1|nr:DUF4238 domain-containing protein [Leuconostoc mesenteroides]MBZ1523891.1 DUF4238 domain-containing protein [Leuconostoc mesenteroides]